MKWIRKKREKGLMVSGPVPLGVLGKDGSTGRKEILADKNRETNCENTTYSSVYNFVISTL